MSDYNSSLPVRTQANGDVCIKICDPTTNTQIAAVTSNNELKVTTTDGAGNLVDPREIRALTNSDVVTVEQSTASSLKAEVNLHDGAGTAITSQTDGSLQPLDVAVIYSGATVDPRDIRALTASDIVTVQLQDGSGNAITSGTQTSARCLDVEQFVNGAVVSTANPFPVVISNTIPGTEVLEYYDSANLAGGDSITKTYTVPANKVFALQKVWATGSGKLKMEVKISDATKLVQFNSTASPNMMYEFFAPQNMAAAATVKITLTNRENQAQDVYCGVEGVLTAV